MGSEKGCLLMGIGYFLVNSVIVSITLIFGGDIYEIQYSYDDHMGESEYTILGNLKTSFIILAISVVIYLRYIWKQKQSEVNSNERKPH